MSRKKMKEGLSANFKSRTKNIEGGYIANFKSRTKNIEGGLYSKFHFGSEIFALQSYQQIPWTGVKKTATRRLNGAAAEDSAGEYSAKDIQ